MRSLASMLVAATCTIGCATVETATVQYPLIQVKPGVVEVELGISEAEVREMVRNMRPSQGRWPSEVKLDTSSEGRRASDPDR